MEKEQQKKKNQSVRLGRYKITLVGEDELVIKTPSVVKVTVIPDFSAVRLSKSNNFELIFPPPKTSKPHSMTHKRT